MLDLVFTTRFGNSKQVHIYNIQILIFNISDKLFDEQSLSVRYYARYNARRENKNV
jgi:hypothetical protein